MSQSTADRMDVQTRAGVPLTVTFDGGRLTSDGGRPWLADADTVLDLCDALAACIPDWRRGPVRHSLATLVRQRVFQIACGSEDQDDADTLRSDPLLVFDGDTDQLMSAVLRPGTAHGGRGAVAILKRLVRALRRRWPGGPIELRADSAFAGPALYDDCDQAGIAYTVGMAPNPRLTALAPPLLAEGQRQQAETGEKVRLTGETPYQADS